MPTIPIINIPRQSELPLWNVRGILKETWGEPILGEGTAAFREVAELEARCI